MGSVSFLLFCFVAVWMPSAIERMFGNLIDIYHLILQTESPIWKEFFFVIFAMKKKINKKSMTPLRLQGTSGVGTIRGTNNQLSNRFYIFVPLQLFHFKLVTLPLYCFPKNVAENAEENDCLWTHILSFGFETHPGK